ncbi:hypothetical protein GCM10012275_28010 [Longimycelium tulufanense]|uniref:TIGR04222 domain-containing membrane protein n=1 Tax=Longimycelium tulufanense TaxID=907463 RepID=A0A8J3FVZ1_9PSEU|nr:TIGR04222 domain-containing membrane protein [Longimycelium tulufanense]GGM55276.1 hypothetical protein GCM10012275_28010 [Longimycelium tulufanense]
MNEPWGFSGPEFLGLYGVGVLLASLWMIRVRGRLRRSDASDVARTQLSAEELAYLAGGPARVIDVAVSRLIDTGAVRVCRAGRLRAVTGATASHPLDAAVLGLLSDGSGRQLAAVRARGVRLEAVRLPLERLVSLDLLVDPRRVWPVKLQAVLPMLALGIVGLFRWINGLASERPVGWLTVLLALTVLLVFLGLAHGTPLRTTRGDALLARVRPTVKEIKPAVAENRSGDGASTAVLTAVALAGIAAMPDSPELSALLSNTGSSGGSGGTSSGDGDGGFSLFTGDSGGGGGDSGGCGGGGCGG